MGRFRSYTRLGLVLLWTLVLFTGRVLAMPVRLVSAAADRAIRRWMFAFWALGMLRITGLRVETRGTLPKAPFFLVCNHVTFLDIVVLASRLGCVFVSRGDVVRWPVFGFLARQMNTIFIDRERLRDTVRVNEEIARAMSDGYGVVVFPEGGVSHTGELLPFKPALLEPPIRLGIPVHYAAIRYRTVDGSPPGDQVAVWERGMSFLDHYLGLAALSHFSGTVAFGPVPISGTDRKQLAAELHRAVKECCCTAGFQPAWGDRSPNLDR